jgi:hypothetical protein
MSKRNNDPLYLKILDEYKQLLKSKKMTYLDLSRKSKIPVSTLKKIFSGADCSFTKLLSIGHALDYHFCEMSSKVLETKSEKLFELSIEQETFFAKNFSYYYFFHLIFRDGLTPQDAKEKMKLSDQYFYKILKKLEIFELVELHPGDEVRFLKEGGISYLPDGPLMKIIFEEIPKKFLDFLIYGQSIDTPVVSPYFRLNFAKVRVETYQQILNEIRKTHAQISEWALRDRKFLNNKNLIDVTWILGLGLKNGFSLMTEKTYEQN